MKKPQKVVTIGGGTGTYTVLTGLKKYPPDFLDLSAVVAVTDSGGSTGRLRDEFGYLPVGDFRMALTALADDTETGNILRKLFLHRFDKGTGLSGHNFGNLFLVAMTDLFGTEEEAIAVASRIFRIRGNVLPVSNEKVTLAARYANGKEVSGETYIDEPPEEHDGETRIVKLWTEPEAAITRKAKEAILGADLIVLGPGDLYTSIAANLVVGGVREALLESCGRTLYILNLMTKYGQTHGFSARDHARELSRYMGKMPDYVMINATPLPEEVVGEYARQQEFPITDDFEKNKGEPRVIRGDFLASERVIKPDGDVLKRSLIRHDSDKLAKAIVELL